MATTVSFVRRENRDSTVDSICLKCYQTIVKANYEAELVSAEEKHNCLPLDLDDARYRDSQRGTF